MAKQFFRVSGTYPGIATRNSHITPKAFHHSGFLGCDMVQLHIIELIKDGVDADCIRVYVDLPGGPEVTKWQVGQALKRMGRKMATSQNVTTTQPLSI